GEEALKIVRREGKAAGNNWSPLRGLNMFRLPGGFGRVGSVAALTIKAAFRFKLFWVLALLLLTSVIALPLLLRDDGTARGFTQILLTYTLSIIGFLLGFATLWLSCGTMARDIEEAQIQMVVTKPVTRYQVWLGKWLGIVTLNALLLSISGCSVYILLQYRSKKLSPYEQALLKSEILVARGSIREVPEDRSSAIERAFKDRSKGAHLSDVELESLHKKIVEEAKSIDQVVEPNYRREWKINMGYRAKTLKDTPIFVRTKFFASQTNAAGLYDTEWRIGPFEKFKRQRLLVLPANTFHEFSIPPEFEEDGTLIIHCINRSQTSLLFPLEDGMEILYPDGSFGLNFVRGLMILFFWLGLMAALGLSAASFLSFPVAAFFSLSILIVGLSGGTISHVVEQGTIFERNHETGQVAGIKWIDAIAVPFFTSIGKAINVIEGFSPVESLSTGRSITWEQTGLAFIQVVCLGAGVIALVGIFIFSRRELAASQVNS
ncbi:MAG: hypothetical protein JWN25_422, partial [Verrucomicrobiales bacterium]|nr:hypothetical protein [Verrucomicrobiales bacterium]